MRISSILSDKRLRKVQQENCEFNDFPMVYKSNIENHNFSDIGGFVELYEAVAARGGALMHGEPIQDGYQRRLSKDDESNGDLKTLMDSGSNILCLDIDKIPCQYKVGTPEHQKDIFMRLGRVVPELANSDCVFAYTSSAGVNTIKNQMAGDSKTNINVHLFYLIPGDGLKAFEMRSVIARLNERFKDAGSSIEFDGSVSKLAQPLYISPPLLLQDLELQRESLIRGVSRTLDVLNLGLVEERKIVENVYIDNEEYTKNVTKEDITEEDEIIAILQIRDNGHSGGSYGGMTGFIKYLKQRLYSRTKIEELWNQVYNGANWTLEDKKTFEDQWRAVDYTVPVYLDGVNEREVYEIGLWKYNDCMIVPGWINGIIALREFGDKPLTLYMSSNTSSSKQESIYRHAKHYFMEVDIKLFEYQPRKKLVNKTGVKRIRKSKQLIELVGEAPGGDFDNFEL